MKRLYGLYDVSSDTWIQHGGAGMAKLCRTTFATFSAKHAKQILNELRAAESRLPIVDNLLVAPITKSELDRLGLRLSSSSDGVS